MEIIMGKLEAVFIGGRRASIERLRGPESAGKNVRLDKKWFNLMLV